jgi:hypothetical protein
MLDDDRELAIGDCIFDALDLLDALVDESAKLSCEAQVELDNKLVKTLQALSDAKQCYRASVASHQRCTDAAKDEVEARSQVEAEDAIARVDALERREIDARFECQAKCAAIDSLCEALQACERSASLGNIRYLWTT